MRKINKSAAPNSFVSLLQHNKLTNWEDFHGKHKAVYDGCVALLNQDQQGLDGYTEKPLKPNTRHIDHFKKKSGSFFPNEEFNWHNFVLAEYVNDKSYGANAKDERIKSKDEYNYLINPVSEDPSLYFEYMANGEIIPRRDLLEKDVSDKQKNDKALFTIDAFQLNHKTLTHKRQQLFDVIQELKRESLDDNGILGTMESIGFPSCMEYYLSHF